MVLKGKTNPGSTTEMMLTATTTGSQIDDMIKTVDAMSQRMTDVGANLGALDSRIEMQQEFVVGLRDVIERGVGRLVDADMNEESTRMKALQTQQQLGIQALSIANSSADSVLSLFR